MINTPPPTVPGTVPAPSVPLPPVSVAADLQQVTQQLQAVLDAIKQQAVLAVTKADLDAAKQLLTLLTPQGAATIKLPPVTPNIPVNTGIMPPSTQQPTPAPGQPLPAQPAVQLPSGQLVQLRDLLTQLASLPPAALKNVFLQFDKATAPGQLPTLKVLLNPQDVMGTKQTGMPVPTQTAQAPTGPIRTLLTPLPESAVRDLGLSLTPQPATTTQTQQPPSPVEAAISDMKAKINALAAKVLGTPQSAPTPVTAGAQPRLVTALNPHQPVDVLTADAADAVQATVLGSTPRGEAIVRTDAGQVFSLAHVRAGAPGSTLLLRNVSPNAGAALPAAEVETLDKMLNDLVRIMQTIDPAIAARVSQQLQATPGPNLGGALLMIFSVLNGGALTNKPGANRQISLAEEIDKALPEGAKSRLLALLNDEPVNLTRLVPDQIGVEWRGHQLPTPNLPGFAGPVWFYVQQQRQDQFGGGSNQSVDTARQTRFVIDLDLTRFGHTQLEGIAATRRLDIKINTGGDLPAGMQKELRDVYANAISGYGLAGAITFSTEPPVDLDGPHDAMRVIS